MTITAIWAMPNTPSHDVVETADGRMFLMPLLPIQDFDAKNLTPYYGPHPAKLKAHAYSPLLCEWIYGVRLNETAVA